MKTSTLEKIITHVARAEAYKIKTVNRPEWVPPSLRNPNHLLQAGTEEINGVTFIRLERWNRRRRAFVLEGLTLPHSAVMNLLRKGYL